MIKMKVFRSLFVVATALVGSSQGFAQGYVDDALRVSKPVLGGTSRTISLGGAYSSLGGDLGTLNANPAGLGFFRKSSLSITPVWNSSNVTTTYFGNKTRGKESSNFEVGNVGIVLAHSTPEADKGLATENRLIGFAFGASYTRGNIINKNASYSGTNPGGSFNSVLAEQANKYGINNQDYGSTLGGIAYDEYLINPTDKSLSSFTPVKAAGASQYGYVGEKGYNDQTNLSFGANFGNVVYVGAGVNFNNLNYQRQTEFNEGGYNDPSGNVDGLTYSKYTVQNGNGVSGKAGLILNLSNAIHLGGFAESPTNYRIYESTDLGLWGLKAGGLVKPSVSYTDPSSGKSVAGSYYPYVSSENSFNIKTPWKFTGGASLILGKFALFTADAEFIDHSETRFLSDNKNQDVLTNAAIRVKYKAVINYKAGAEIKIGPLIFRGGYAFYPSQLKDNTTDADRRLLTGGFGIRSGNFFIDFGAVKDFSHSYRTLYTNASGTGPVLKEYNAPTDRNLSLSGANVTIGTRF